MRWSIAFLRWTIIVSIGILGRTVAVLNQAIVVFGRTIGFTDSMITFCTLMGASSAWRAGRTLVRLSGSSPRRQVVHLTWPPAVGEAWLRCGSVQGDKTSTAGWRLDRGWSKLVAH